MCFANRISAHLSFFSFFFSSFRCWQRFYYFFAQDKQLSHLKGATLRLSQRCSSRPFPPSLINSTENKKIWKISSGRITGQIVKSVWKRPDEPIEPTAPSNLLSGVVSRVHSMQRWELLKDSFVKGNQATTKLILDADTAVGDIFCWKIL